MTASLPAAVDLRGFRWRLAPVQRKLEWEREAAKARLADRLQQALRATSQVAELEATRNEQAAAAARVMRARGDAHAHAQALVYLSALASRMVEAERERQAAESQADAARAECLACQRRLDTLVAARDSALGQHVRQELQRESKEADAAWLMLRAGDRHPMRDEGGAEA